MYAVVEGAAKDNVSGPEAEGFFSSFKLSDKAKNLVPKN
jgi:hypothetical protein